MSWNASRFKVKLLEDLKVPVEGLFPKGDKTIEQFHPKRFVNSDGTVDFILSAGGGINGKIVDDVLHVTSLDSITDDGSGYAIEYILLPALKESTGKVTFSIVWESGESLERIEVVDGEVKRIDIEI